MQPLNSFFIVSSAFSPSGPSKLTFPSLRIGVSWLHSSAWKNQLPVMFQPQNSGFLKPASRSLPQFSTTSSQVVGGSVMPAFLRASML